MNLILKQTKNKTFVVLNEGRVLQAKLHAVFFVCENCQCLSHRSAKERDREIERNRQVGNICVDIFVKYLI